MSEHTPLTEAEREALLTRVRERLGHEQRWVIMGRESNVRCLDCDLRYGDRDEYGCHKTGRGHTFDEEELAEARAPQPDDIDRDLAALLDLAARTSTATADTEARFLAVLAACELAEAEARHVVDDEVYVSVGLIRNALNGLDATPGFATTDTRLRERVALLLDLSCHHCGRMPERGDGDHTCLCPKSHSECLTHTVDPVVSRTVILAALDATPASTEDRCTEHDPVYDRTIYECGHAHGYCRHCGETTEPCPPTEDRADNEARCPTCGPTTTEQHPRHDAVIRCANCKEWL